MIVEGYTIHLYCDDPGHPWPTVPGGSFSPGEFAGHRIRQAFREASAAGWEFYREGGEKKCRCPDCAARRRA